MHKLHLLVTIVCLTSICFCRSSINLDKKSQIDTCFLSPFERVSIQPHLSALAAEGIDVCFEAAVVETAAADVLGFDVVAVIQHL